MLTTQLTKRLRDKIEWHFYNFPADMSIYKERRREILESGMGVNYERVGSGGGLPSNPTERKAILLEELEQEKTWATVVRNTFNAFRFEPEYKVMEQLYVHRVPYKELFCKGVGERTYWRWRDNWLEYAYKWAKKFRLL